MNHCFVDRDLIPMPSWLDAFPKARLMRRENLSLLPNGEPVILWVRFRSGERLESVLPSAALEPWQLLVLLADEPDDDVITDALALGASGCCNTHAAAEVLQQVALVVENGGLWVGQSLLRRLVGGTSRALAARSEQRPPRVDWATVLSEREVQVARLVAGGASNREVAEQLAITERTVKAHLSAIFEKLGLRDRLQLSLRINGVQV